MKPHESHRAKGRRRLRVEVVTASTSRYSKKRSGEGYTDEAGDAAEEEARKAGYAVTRRKLISDERSMLRRVVKSFLGGDEDVLVITGGTGISKRDVTIETVRPFFQKEVEGFGELFRSISFEEVGAAAMLTRATMGVRDGKLIACLPGSPGAVRTAMKAFAKEFPHAVFVARG